MAKTYRVLSGNTFHDVVEGKTRAITGGQEIQLEDDVAAMHVGRIELVPEPDAKAVQTSAPPKGGNKPTA